MANDFSGDSNVQGVYTYASYAGQDDATDTSGKGNTLTAANFGSDIRLEETLVKVGLKSARCLRSDIAYMLRTDANLSDDFPGKDTTSNRTFTVCFWAYPEDITSNSNGYTVTKLQQSGNGWSWGVIWEISGGSRYWKMYIGYNGGASTEGFNLPSLAIVVDRWYHVAMTYDGSTKAKRIRVWDENGSTVYEATETGTEVMEINNQSFRIFSRGDATRNFIGVLDEVVIWDRALSADEIDEVRQGIFGGGAPTKIHHYKHAGGL